VIKPAYSVSFLLSINTFVWQNILYFLSKCVASQQLSLLLMPQPHCALYQPGFSAVPSSNYLHSYGEITNIVALDSSGFEHVLR
jgi:hypothetical protein